MKINSSAIQMDAGRFYSQSTEYSKETLSTEVTGAQSNYTSYSFLQTYAEYSGTSSSNEAAKQYDQFTHSADGENNNALLSNLYTNSGNAIKTIDVKDYMRDFHRQLFKQLEEFMERIREQLLGKGTYNAYSYEERNLSIVDLNTTNTPGSFWTLKSQESYSYSENEAIAFQTTGKVETADGRSIDFDLSLEMSRSFVETSQNISEQTQYILTDPLVIQLENAPETISDQTWKFDIDGDGVLDEISQLAKGNAFLALDENENGTIDDGSELFGTKSGNGFADLAAYDEDHNGWIDENDSVYSKLRVWTKDASGNDKLMTLQQADVGAIYLGSAQTQFSHKNIENETKAVVRQTGFYLHESTGQAGIMQQIDFAS